MFFLLVGMPNIVIAFSEPFKVSKSEWNDYNENLSSEFLQVFFSSSQWCFSELFSVA